MLGPEHEMVGIGPSSLARLLWLVMAHAEPKDDDHGAMIEALIALDLDPGLGNPDKLTELFN